MPESIVTRYPNIKAVTGGVDTPLTDIIATVRNGTHHQPVGMARAAYQQGGKRNPAYTQAKNALPYFTPGGTFSHRSSNGLTQSAGLLQGDIDELTPNQLAYARASLIANPHTVYVFTSPSGAGLKFAFAIETVRDNGQYRRHFDALCSYIKEQYQFAIDEACKSISHACFLSYDPDAYYNPHAKAFAPALSIANNRPQPQRHRPANDLAKLPHEDKRFNTLLAKIENAPDGQKHHTRLNVAITVGGLIEGGQLDPRAADIVADVARANSARPELAGRDVADGLRYGKARPLYKEAELYANSGVASLGRNEQTSWGLYAK